MVRFGNSNIEEIKIQTRQGTNGEGKRVEKYVTLLWPCDSESDDVRVRAVYFF